MTAERQRRPRWMPADVVLVVVMIVLGVAVLGVVAASIVVFASNARAADARIGTSLPLSELREGDCVATFPQTATPEFTVMDCDEPHAAEFIFLVEESAALDENLSDAALLELSNTYCQTSFTYRLHLSDAVDDLPHAAAAGYVGTKASFAGGARFHCFLYNVTGEPLVGDYYVADEY